MKSRTLVALALLVLVGGATVWKVTRPDPHVRRADAPQPFTVKKEDVDELEITEAGKPAVVLKKDGAVWKLVQPVADKADARTVEAAVDAIAEVRLRDVIAESPESYEKVGVADKDLVKVVPKKAGKPLAVLLVGKTDNVRLEGDPKVYATANLKRWSLVKEPKLWRDRKILDANVDDIEKLEVAYPAAKIVARREAPPAPDPKTDPKAPAPPPPAPKWALLEGADKLGGALDENAPLELASTVSRLMADDFADDKTTPASAGLEPPRATVTVTLKGGKTESLLLGKEEDGKAYVKLAGGPRIWKIQKWEADRIPSSPSQWRDKTVLRLEPAEVVRVEVTKDKDKTVLERVDADKWKLSSPDGIELDPAKATALVRAAQAVKATKVLDGVDVKTAGLDKPRATVILTKRDGTAVKILLGADKDGQTPAQISGQKDLVDLPSYVANNFVKAPADFKKTAGGDAPPPM